MLNAHVENATPVTLAADAVTDAFPEAFVALASWWETLPADETGALAGFPENGGHGHGGPVELSVTRAIAPELVRPELAEDLRAPGGRRPAPSSSPRPARVAPHGYHGRASEIDAGHGERLLELAAERIASSIDALLAHLGS